VVVALAGETVVGAGRKDTVGQTDEFAGLRPSFIVAIKLADELLSQLIDLVAPV